MTALPHSGKSLHMASLFEVESTLTKSSAEMASKDRHPQSTSKIDADMNHCARVQRNRSPVFVIGCHRSGTNLLYDMLLSAGGFAVYRGYLPVYKMLVPKLGQFNNASTRQKLVDIWLRSKGFRRSGLDAAEVASSIERECRNGGDFIRITMDAIARKQHVNRWALYDPDNVLHVPKIKADIPDALFIHIIRDGRDIALSLRKMRGFRPLPWDRRTRSLLATAAYWEWMVRKGQQHGRKIPSDYIEIRYEDLLSDPQTVLDRVGAFLDQEIDYAKIQSKRLGRLSESNSSFRDEEPGSQRPVRRWKERLSSWEIAQLEVVIGDCLQELGYQLSSSGSERAQCAGGRWMRFLYPAYLDVKLWLKTSTRLGRFADLSEMELQEQVPEKAQD